MKYLIAVFMILISGCIESPFAPDEEIPSFVGRWENAGRAGPIENLNKDSSYFRIHFTAGGRVFSANEYMLWDNMAEYKKGEWWSLGEDSILITWTKYWRGGFELPISKFVKTDSVKLKAGRHEMDLEWQSGDGDHLFKIDSFPRPKFLPDSVDWL